MPVAGSDILPFCVNSFFSKVPFTIIQLVFNNLTLREIFYLTFSGNSLISDYCKSLLFESVNIVEGHDASFGFENALLSPYKLLIRKEQLLIFKTYLRLVSNLTLHLDPTLPVYSIFKLFESNNIFFQDLSSVNYNPIGYCSDSSDIFNEHFRKKSNPYGINTFLYDDLFDFFVRKIVAYNTLHTLKVTRIKNLSKIKFFFELSNVNLKKLSISYSEFDEYEKKPNAGLLLKNLSKLQFLDLSNNFHFSNNLIFSNLPSNLKFLDLSCNNISSIENLNHLGSLSHLDLSGNCINHLCNLHGLTSLEYLNVSKMDFSFYSFERSFLKIGDISYLKSLKVLNASNNSLSKIDKTLNQLSSLSSLNLSGNFIKVIENIDKLTNLKKLDLSYNLIASIKPINPICCLKINLVYLNLNYNCINEIKGICQLDNLKYLFLTRNYINGLDLEQLRVLKNLKNLVCEY
ncbi:L domain-like protein [Ascoidea rubescens DSM 1968]|uniref:L domain-like protein n=1 Tax=Ascoidea rubescens DSM 1968 TaxID=1344418 RepID=A0A1D2VD03_9ASCO|nr:L domain-like protein [Ascoidea rubescens DSM 1968]ODV59511.1 L domain-like protein [Ascoidea rubescens DSM 1968]